MPIIMIKENATGYVISDETRALMSRYVESFKKWVNTDSVGIENHREHLDHKEFLQGMLSEDNVDKLTEDGLREVYKKLWASNIWGNKDWYVNNKLLLPYGILKIKLALKNLLYGTADIAERWDEFDQQIKGFGPSSKSEILNFVFPDKYCLWNDKPKTVLPILKIDYLPERYFRYQLKSGGDYYKCNQVLGALKNELKKYGLNPDYVTLDELLWHIFIKNPLPKKRNLKPEATPVIGTPSLKDEIITSHEQAEYYLLELGNVLSFDTYVTASDQAKECKTKKLQEIAKLKELPDFAGRRDKNSAQTIDVMWFNDEGNPVYCFEVEHTTDIRGGMNRLYQLKQFNVKFVIVAEEERRSKFEIEMNKAPYRQIRDKYKFMSYDELVDLFKAAERFYTKKKVLL